MAKFKTKVRVRNKIRTDQIRDRNYFDKIKCVTMAQCHSTGTTNIHFSSILFGTSLYFQFPLLFYSVKIYTIPFFLICPLFSSTLFYTIHFFVVLFYKELCQDLYYLKDCRGIPHNIKERRLCRVVLR